MEIHGDLYERIRKCWGPDTSSDPVGWSQVNPAWGQCAVTACVVQDVLGGDIVWANALSPDNRSYSHYFNAISDGTIIDFTREQFPPGTEFSPCHGCPKTVGNGKTYATTRDYVLSFPATELRYQLMRRRLRKNEH